MEIPILSGVITDEQANINASLPINLEIIPSPASFSKAYLRSAPGVTAFGDYPGADFGGVIWNGTHYRTMDTMLVKVAQDGTTTAIGTAGIGRTRFDYSFTHLMISRGKALYLYDGTTIQEVTDPDLGKSIDALWMRGQFVSTDGKSIVVTQISDPFSVDPNKYIGAEDDPDPIVGLLRIGTQLVALGGNTIQFFSYTGGSGFPFDANLNATISIGCVGRFGKVLYDNGFAWVGQRRNQQLGVWYSEGGDPVKLSTREVDERLANEPNPQSIQVEERTDHNERRLYIHLSDCTLVYLKTASEALQSRVWYVAYGDRTQSRIYRPRHPVLAYGQWVVGFEDGVGLGVIDETTSKVKGAQIGWQFDTPLAYNESKGGIMHRIDLTGMPGRGGPSTAFMSWTLDGETWSEERACAPIPSGGRTNSISWRPHKRFGTYLGLRFRGDSGALASWSRIDAEVEGLSV